MAMTEAQAEGVRRVIEILDAIVPYTVGDMKKAIEGLPDDTQIIIGHGDAETTFDWANLKFYSLPDEDEGVFGLTFALVDNFDGRQF